MAEEVKYQSTLISSRNDGNLDYPLEDGKDTYGKLAYSEDIFDKNEQRALSDILKDKTNNTDIIDGSRIKDESITADKIKDNNVTWNKLSAESQELIKAGTGVDGDLISDMEDWNNRIAKLESGAMNLTTKLSADDVIEAIDNNSHIWMTIVLQANNNQISLKEFTNIVIKYSIDSVANLYRGASYTEAISMSTPKAVLLKASGNANYKGVDVVFPQVTKTIYAVLPSYIGYIDDINNWNKTGTKLVKHNLSGSYNVTNNYSTPAYLVVAIPKDGQVNGITNIVQHGTLDAQQYYTKIEKDDYILYVCNTAHNSGTYNFILS